MVLKCLPARNPDGPPQPAVASRDFDLSGAGQAGKKKALLVGVNYRGKVDHTGGSVGLEGCINDANNVHRMLVRKYGFEDANIRKLTEDEDPSAWPTSANIKSGVEWLMDGAEKGDLLWFSFSGHGCQIASKDNTEEDGLDEVLCPLDAWDNGGRNFYTHVVTDDWLNEHLHEKLPDGVKCVCSFDCCHSGTMADLEVQRDFEVGESVVYEVEMRGVKLAAKDSMMLGGKSDPFLIIRKQTKDGDIILDQHNDYIKNTLDPTFKKFKIKVPKEGRLFIQCCDHDFNSTDIIGEATIPVSDLVEGKEIELQDYKERPAAELEKYRKDNPKWPGVLVVQSLADVTADSEPPQNRSVHPPAEYMVRPGVTRYCQMVRYLPNGTPVVETVKIVMDQNGRQHVEKINSSDRGYNPFPGMEGWFRQQASRFSQYYQQPAPAPAPAPSPAPAPAGEAQGKMLWTISGCQDHQTSADATIDGQRQGAMTWALLKTLDEANGNITYGALLDTMKTKIEHRGYEQVPSISTTHNANYNVNFMG